MATDPNIDIEQETKRKVTMIAIPLLGGAYLLSSLLCTYLVAADVNFNPVLGGTEILGLHLYSPFAYSDWKENAMIAQAIPDILNDYKWYRPGIMAVAIGIVYLINQAYKKDISHGSAEFATNKDIIMSDLGHYVTKNGGVFEKDEQGRKIVKKSGVVVGRNPYNKEIMLHDGPEHVLLMAPTRSGKGVNTIIPTGLVWKASIFFFDPKGELWAITSGYRKTVLKQKVMKFEPLCIDGSTNRWNPLAEINFRTNEEISDVSTIVSVMVKPDGEKKGGGDPFWDNSASNLLNGVIMHLMYKHYKENLPLPSPTDIMSFLSSPDKDTNELFDDMMTYPHITPDEFLEREHPVIKKDYLGNPCLNAEGLPVFVQKLDKEGKPVIDENGHPVYETECYVNPLRAIYGEYYVRDLKKINDALSMLVNAAINKKSKDEKSDLETKYPKLVMKEKNGRLSFKSQAKTISEIRDNIAWAIDAVGVPSDDTTTDSIVTGKICWGVRDDEDSPFHRLLTHPRVAEQAAVMRNGAEQTRASIMQTAQTALGIYGDPVVQGNMCVSDFCIRDLLDPRQEISCYLVMQVKDIATVKPIARLFINTILNKLIRDMKFEKDTGQKKAKKQRLLLMLDEFPQLGNMQAVELALAICAGYGIKMCIVCQDVNQLNKQYSKDNSIASNCHVHIYFTPNLETGAATAEGISKILGKRTIKSISRSDGGGIGKGSNSISSQARDLMTPDEVARMSTEEELVFVAGHKPIKGGKLRYYQEPWFTKRILDPPKLSDQVTRIESYGELFKMHEADTLERNKKIAEIAEAKRLRAEEERKANEGPVLSVQKASAQNEQINTSAEKEDAEDKNLGFQPLPVTEPDTAGGFQHQDEPEPGGFQDMEESNENENKASENSTGEKPEQDSKSGQAQENQEASAQRPRSQDEKPVSHPRRIPHGKKLAVYSASEPTAGDDEGEKMDREAIDSIVLEINNIYSAFKACDVNDDDDRHKAFQLANQHKRLANELGKLSVDEALESRIKRQTTSIANQLSRFLQGGPERNATDTPEPLQKPLEYQKPEVEKMDGATASILDAVADAAGDDTEEAPVDDNENKEDIVLQIGSGPNFFNTLVENKAEKDDGNGTSES